MAPSAAANLASLSAGRGNPHHLVAGLLQRRQGIPETQASFVHPGGSSRIEVDDGAAAAEISEETSRPSAFRSVNAGAVSPGMMSFRQVVLLLGVHRVDPGGEIPA